MKILLSILIATSVQAYYEDHPEVMALVGAGVPAITERAPECSRGPHADMVGAYDRYNQWCVTRVALPTSVESELSIMRANQLENWSDYDVRISEVHVFEQSRFGQGFSLSEVRQLAAKLGIPSDQLGDLDFSVFHGDDFNRFEFINYTDGPDFVENGSQTAQYLKQLLDGHYVFQVSFGKEVALYPGGGFNVRYFLFVFDDKVVYVKQPWWNS